jgi:hypothetical protein
VTVADVDGDQRPDIIATTASGIAVFLNKYVSNGDGIINFGAATVYATEGTTQPTTPQVVDVNRDGVPDITVSNSFSISTLFGQRVGGSTKSQSDVSVGSSLALSDYGESVVLTATVTSVSSPITGLVTFLDGSNQIGSANLSQNVAVLNVSNLSVGQHSISAFYEGDSTHSGSTSTILLQTVIRATINVTLTSSDNPQLLNDTVTLTAVVNSQFNQGVVGSVVFKAGSKSIGTVILRGNQASLTTSFATVGSRSIIATYSGDSNDTGNSSPALKQSVVASLPTTTLLTSSVNPSFVGQNVVLTATLVSTGPTAVDGEVMEFREGSTILASVPMTAGVATFSTTALPVGTASISAHYSGDSILKASTSSILKQVVAKYATSVSLTASQNPSTCGQSVTLTAIVTSAGPLPTGTVTFKNGSVGLGTVSVVSGTATLTTSKLPAGTLTLNAMYNGDAASARSPAPTLSELVAQATTTTSVVSSRNPSKSGQTVRFTATVNSSSTVPTGSVIFTAGASILGTINLSGGKATLAVTNLTVGSQTITATYDGTVNIEGSSGSVMQIEN